MSSHSPTSGSTAGSTAVTVIGSDFLRTDGLACRFGVSVALATYTSASVLRCMAPAATSAGLVSLAVSINNVDFAGQREFLYYSVPAWCGGGPLASVLTLVL
jgi:hypothetical protein